MYAHGITFGGHPVSSAVALKNLEIMQREHIVENVAEQRSGRSATSSRRCSTLDIVGDLRGAGYFWALELVKDKETRETFSDDESETLLRGFLSPQLFERGLICRADDRGDPVVQISPPLVAGPQEFAEIVGILGEVLTELGGRSADGYHRRSPHSTRRRSRWRRRASSSSRCGGSTWCSSPSARSSGSTRSAPWRQNGPQGFLWLVVLAVVFVAPYMLVMAEVGERVHEEGGPYEWVEARVRAPARRHRRGSLLGHEPALGRRLARVHRDRLMARERLRHRSRHLRRLPLQAHLHLDLDRRRDHLAAPGQVDPELRRVHALRRARLLLDHRRHLRDRARRRRLPAPPS